MTDPTFGLPGSQQAIDPKTGGWISAWYQWAVRISQLSAERPFDPQSVGSSPFVFTASTIGHVIVQGGAVSSIVLTRSGVSITCQANTFIPVAANDTVTVTYTGAPSVTFVPSARA